MSETTVTIEAKMSGTGTIHDIASEHFDRDIVFGENDEYAIVLAAYYGNNIYYTATDGYEAVEIIEREKEFSMMVIDRDGDQVDTDWLYREYA